MIRRLSPVVLLLALVSSGCGVNGLNFIQDERVTITAPGDRAEVALPVELRWDVTDFDITGRDDSARDDAGYFGIYVDRAPQPPSLPQEWLLRDDEDCARTPSCPDEAYLAQFGIHSTTEREFLIERVAESRSGAQRRREFHEATIVLLNGRGERIGESAFTVQFEVER